jgi:integrase
MANIEKRTNKKGETSFRVKIRIKGHPVVTATFDKQAKAKDWIQITEQKIKDGKYGIEENSKKYTVNDIINRYIKTVLIHKGKIKQDWEGQLKWWSNQIGEYALNKITPALLSETRDILLTEKSNRGKVRSTSTVNRYTTTLQCVFAVAINEWELLESNPFLRVKKLPEPKGRIRALSKPEKEALLKECKKATNPYLFPAVILALSTGARKMEVLSLKWEDINLETEFATLHDTKNGDRRSISLIGPVKELVLRLYENKRPSDIYVFPSMDGKKPFDITRSWKKAIKSAEIENFRFHDLRHTTASYLAEQGKSQVQIAEMLGHKTLQMVKRYSHLTESHKKELTADMNNAIFGDYNE